MSILWISDFFLTNGVRGGAELVDDIVINSLREENEVNLRNSSNVTKEDIESNSHIFVSNFINLSAPHRLLLKNKTYFIFEHDHKYLSTRDPSPFNDHLAPPKFITNKEFYSNAKYIFCQSAGHALSLAKNLFIDNIVNLGGSMWTTEQYESLKSLSADRVLSTKYAVLDSPNDVKNTHLAEIFCRKNNIEYDLISDNSWDKFIEKLSSYKGLVFFPKVYESFCRLAVEARSMNIELITNSNIGASSEAWFSDLKGPELVLFLQNKKKEILLTIKQALVGEIETVPVARPMVSIITSMYKGTDHLEPFLENIVNQTYFPYCELIVVNAASPEDEDPIIAPYLEKYTNIKYKKLQADPGLYGTWNHAIEISTGKYITNANLDDRRALNQIEELVRFMEFDDTIDLAYTECYVTDKDGENFYKNSSKGRVYSAKPFSAENMIKCLPGCMPMWRRLIHELAGPFNEKYKMAGDWEMWLRAVRAGAEFRKIETPLGMYFLNPEGLSTSKETARAKARHEEEKEIFWEYTDVFGSMNTAIYKGHFSQKDD